MPEKIIEDYICETLKVDVKDNALSFVAYLRSNDMQINRFTYHGEDMLHWEVKFQDQLVCYILLDSENSGWIVMLDISSTERFADYDADDDIKETAWKNINICHDGNRCGSCENGRRTNIKIFGKVFDDVCGMAYNFTNPDEMSLTLLKKMIDIRKNDIIGG